MPAETALQHLHLVLYIVEVWGGRCNETQFLKSELHQNCNQLSLDTKRKFKIVLMKITEITPRTSKISLSLWNKFCWV